MDARSLFPGVFCCSPIPCQLPKGCWHHHVREQKPSPALRSELKGRSSSNRSLRWFVSHFPSSRVMASSLLTGSSAPPSPAGKSIGGAVAISCWTRRLPREGNGYFRGQTGRDRDPMQQRYRPEQLGNILGGDNTSPWPEPAPGAPPSPRRKPCTRGAALWILLSLVCTHQHRDIVMVPPGPHKAVPGHRGGPVLLHHQDPSTDRREPPCSCQPAWGGHHHPITALAPQCW